MQIQSLTSPQLLRFEFASETQRQSLMGRLARGQVLEARVLDRLSEGRWAIRFMGHILVAESRLSLVPGQLVEARVEALGPPLLLSLSGKSRSEDAALTQALRQLALADDTVNRAIVKALIARGRPVGRRDVQALRDLLPGLGVSLDPEDPQQLEELVSRMLFLRSQGLPVTPDTLAAYLSHLPAVTLGGILEGLADLLRSLRLPGRPEFDFRSLAGRIRSAIPEGGTLTGDTLRQLLGELGLDLEGRLAARAASGRGGVDDSLKLALLRLQARLGDLDPDTLGSAVRRDLDALQERLVETLRFLDTLQASNLPSAGREALHLQLPLLLDGQPRTVDLRISCRKDGERRWVDPDNLRLSLALDLSALGPIRIDLSVTNRQALCNIHTAGEEAAAFLQDAADELRTGLEKCGYTVSNITCKAMREETDGDGGNPPTVGLDLRV